MRTMTLMAALVLVLAGCRSPIKPTPLPVQPDRLPAVQERIVAVATDMTAAQEQIASDAKEIVRAAEPLGSPPEIVEPAKRIEANAAAVHEQAAVLLGPVRAELKQAQSEQVKASADAKAIAKERDTALRRLADAESSWLMRISAACFVLAFVAFALCFVPLIDKRLAVAGGVSLVVAGGFFAALAKWLGLIALVSLGVVTVGVGGGLLWLWRTGRLTDGRLAGVAKLIREGHVDQAIAALRAAVPELDIMFRRSRGT